MEIKQGSFYIRANFYVTLGIIVSQNPDTGVYRGFEFFPSIFKYWHTTTTVKTLNTLLDLINSDFSSASSSSYFSITTVTQSKVLFISKELFIDNLLAYIDQLINYSGSTLDEERRLLAQEFYTKLQTLKNNL